MPPSRPTDAALVSATRSGQPDAFRALVERYQGLACAVAYSATGDPQQSEDLAQEAFVLAWDHLDRLQDPSRFRTWLCAIVRNLARGADRHARRHAPATRDAADAGELPSAQPSPLELAIEKQSATLLWRSLEQIAPIYREPLVLYYRENQSLVEVAAALDISEGTAKQRLARGRRQLARNVRATVERSLRSGRARVGLAGAVMTAVATRGRPMPAALAGTAAITRGVPGSWLSWARLPALSGAAAAAALSSVSSVFAVWAAVSAGLLTPAAPPAASPAAQAVALAPEPRPEPHPAPADPIDDATLQRAARTSPAQASAARVRRGRILRHGPAELGPETSNPPTAPPLQQPTLSYRLEFSATGTATRRSAEAKPPAVPFLTAPDLLRLVPDDV